jgi:DNA-binding response OmpR family regulator
MTKPGTIFQSRGAAPYRGVLLVCPDPQKLGLLAGTLNQAGVLSLTAQNAENSWECVKSGAVSVIVMELSLITADALYLIHAVRSSKRRHRLPFLFLVPAGNLFSKITAGEEMLTRDAWLQIPASSREFIAAVQKMLALPVETESDESADVSPSLLDIEGIEGVEFVSGTHVVKAAEAPKSVGLRTEKIAEPSALLSGRLEALDVTKILGMIEPLGLVGCLTVRSGERSGGVYFEGGEIKHAEFAGIEGKDALLLMFHLHDGYFFFEPNKTATKRSLAGSATELLLDGLRQMDEARKIVREFRSRKVARTIQEAEISSLEPLDGDVVTP